MKNIFAVILAILTIFTGCSSGDSIIPNSSENSEQNSENSSLNQTPAEPSASVTNGNTVLTTAADARNSQTLYLWEEGNVPAMTEYTVNNGNYFDNPDFRPYVVTFPVPEGTEVKGAVLICAGGAFQYRSDANEGTPVAQELSRRGFASFVVNYRLRPYTQEEGALDLARAVRFVRKNADYVGMVSANDVPDKMKKAGFTVTKSEFVDAPIINELARVRREYWKSVIQPLLPRENTSGSLPMKTGFLTDT